MTHELVYKPLISPAPAENVEFKPLNSTTLSIFLELFNLYDLKGMNKFLGFEHLPILYAIEVTSISCFCESPNKNDLMKDVLYNPVMKDMVELKNLINKYGTVILNTRQV